MDYHSANHGELLIFWVATSAVEGVLAGQHQSGALVPARVAVPLLAALLPMRQGTLRSFVEKA